jgi:serine phosphatase RsbU (regulator of sigma subunit)
MTAAARHTLRAAALTSADPAELLRALNDALVRKPGPAPFCTVAVARVHGDGPPFSVEVVAGGHPAPLLRRRDGTTEPVDATGRLVGAVMELDLHPAALELRSGDALVLYTDGVVEVRRDGADWDTERLRETIAGARAADAHSLAGIIESRALEAHGASAVDDLAVLVARAL